MYIYVEGQKRMFSIFGQLPYSNFPITMNAQKVFMYICLSLTKLQAYTLRDQVAYRAQIWHVT